MARRHLAEQGCGGPVVAGGRPRGRHGLVGRVPLLPQPRRSADRADHRRLRRGRRMRGGGRTRRARSRERRCALVARRARRSDRGRSRTPTSTHSSTGAPFPVTPRPRRRSFPRAGCRSCCCGCWPRGWRTSEIVVGDSPPMTRTIRSDFAQLRRDRRARRSRRGAVARAVRVGPGAREHQPRDVRPPAQRHSRLRRVLHAADAARVRVSRARVRDAPRVEPRVGTIAPIVRSLLDHDRPDRRGRRPVEDLWRGRARSRTCRSSWSAARSTGCSARTVRARRRPCACSWVSSDRARGSTRLFGEPVTPELPATGAGSARWSNRPRSSRTFPGMRNLRLWWEAGGARMKDADLDGALAIAGLDTAINRKVKTYSQGMKQRLGFARLLLGRPELLVLDEPTNGWIPARSARSAS